MNIKRERAKEILGSRRTLSQRAVRGGVWVFALKAIERIFGLTKLVILARILAPSDFGLLGIALVTMATLDTFTNTGFQTALIQKKESTEAYLDSAWTILIFRGFVIFVILYFIAPVAAIFFKTPEAKSIIQVVGFTMLFKAFTNVGVIYFQKELDFNKQFIYQLSGTLADFIVAISAAFILRNVWALVFGLLAGNFVRFIVSYFISPYRPHISKDFRKAKELFSYGKWILGSSILLFLILQGDDIFIGKMLGVAALGLYQMAYRIANMPTTALSHVMHDVTFPAYAKIQDNPPMIREAYLKILNITAFSSFLISGLIFALAPDFTKIFLGEKWMPMVPAMQVLVLAGLVRSLAVTGGTIFHAIGKPQIDTKLQIIRLSVLAALIYPLSVKWGITGASIAVFWSIFFANLGFSFMVIKITGCGFKRYGKAIGIPLVSMLVMVSSIFALRSVIDRVEIGVLVLLVGVGVLVYLAISYLHDRIFDYGIQSLIKHQLFALRGIGASPGN